MKTTGAIISILYVLALSAGAAAGQLHVPGEYATIQAGIDAAYDGDTVIVAPGTYTGEGNRDIDFLGKAITVRSESGPENCIIDCNGSGDEPHRGFWFHSGEDGNSVLDGFTITNGYNTSGGGILCERSSPVISDCIICNCHAQYGGGIQLSRDSSPTIINCIISRNSTGALGQGAGIHSNRSNPTIVNCQISENHAMGFGGGIFSWDGHPLIRNCTISGNLAKRGEHMWGRGGGIFCIFASPEIANCTITGNSAPRGNGGGFCCFKSQPTFINCIFWNNTASQGNQIALGYPEYSDESIVEVSYANVEGGRADVYVQPRSTLIWEHDNVDSDPCFVEAGYWDTNGVWVEGDYRLLGGSLCIDTGDPNYVAGPNEIDLDGNPRVINGRIDMGAYEYSPPIPAEIDINPNTLNLQSKGRWISCYIVLAEGYDAADIEPNSVLLEEEIPADRVVLESGALMVKFSRSALQQMLADLETPAEVELLVNGELVDGTFFEGTDTIRVIGKRSGKASK